MIRNKTQFAAIQKKLEQHVSDMLDLKARAQDDPVAAEELRDTVRYVKNLKAILREFEALSDPNSWKAVVPLWQMETLATQISQALYVTRTCAGLNQEELATRLKINQSSIAKLESMCKENFTTQTLSQWGKVSGYELLSCFVRTGGGYNDPATICRLGIEAAAIKGMFAPNSLEGLSVFLNRIGAVCEADIVTCYLGAPDSNALQLVHQSGADHDLDLYLGSAALCSGLLRQQPRFVNDATADCDFSKSSFAAREGVRTVFYLPFETATGPGIVFVNYRRLMPTPTDVYWSSIKSASHLLSFLMCGNAGSVSVANHPHSAGDYDYDNANRIAARLFREALNTDVNSQGDNIAKPESLKPLLTIASESLGIKFDRWDVASPSVIVPLGQVSCSAEPATGQAEAYAGVTITDSDSGNIACGTTIAGELSSGGFLQVSVRPENANSSGWTIRLNPESQELSPEWITRFGGVARALSVMLDTSSMIRKARTKRRVRSLVKTLEISVRDKAGPADRLHAVARLVNELFGSAIVDLWPIDWQSGRPRFTLQDGVRAVNSKFANKSLEALAPRDSGNSTRLALGAASGVMPIGNAVADRSVSHGTVQLGIKALIGAPIIGPDCYRPDGVIWIRFDTCKEFTAQDRRDVQVIARFVHLIWNPASYYLIPAAKRQAAVSGNP